MHRRVVIAFALAGSLWLMPRPAAPAPDNEKDVAKPVPLQEVKLDVARLKGWGTRKFVYIVDRNGERTTLGTVVMRTAVSDNRVDLHDSWALNWKDKDISLEMKIACKPGSLLRPTSIESVGKGDDEFGTFTAHVGDEKSRVKMDGGRIREMAVPPDTLTDHAMFRVFTLLPREKGKAYAVGHTLEVSELNLKGPGEIACEGPDEITLQGRELKLTRFVFRQQGRIVEEAWVDGDGALRQVRIDGRKLLVEGTE